MTCCGMSSEGTCGDEEKKRECGGSHHGDTTASIVSPLHCHEVKTIGGYTLDAATLEDSARAVHASIDVLLLSPVLFDDQLSDDTRARGTLFLSENLSPPRVEKYVLDSSFLI